MIFRQLKKPVKVAGNDFFYDSFILKNQPQQVRGENSVDKGAQVR